MYDPDDDHRLSFVAQKSSRDELLFTFRTFDQEKFLAIAAWIGERQNHWAEWRAVAEQAEGPTLDEYLAPRWPKDYLENVTDVTITEHPIMFKGVTIAMHLLPTRQVDIIMHVFKTSELQNAFLGWVKRASYGMRLGLSLEGLLKGRQELAVRMNSIAEAELATGEKLMLLLQQMVEEGCDEVYLHGGLGSL